jgi:hypothetical protein
MPATSPVATTGTRTNPPATSATPKKP